MPAARRCCSPAAWTSSRAISCRSRSDWSTDASDRIARASPALHPAKRTTKSRGGRPPRLFIALRAELLGGSSSLGGGLRGGGSGDVFLDARGLALEVAQVVQLGAAHLALALHGDRLDGRAVRLEHTLHARAVRDLAHGEGRMQTAAALGDDNALERLHALAIAFLHLDVDHHGVAGAEVRQLAGDLLGFELFDDLVHGNTCVKCNNC